MLGRDKLGKSGRTEMNWCGWLWCVFVVTVSLTTRSNETKAEEVSRHPWYKVAYLVLNFSLEHSAGGNLNTGLKLG